MKILLNPAEINLLEAENIHLDPARNYSEEEVFSLTESIYEAEIYYAQDATQSVKSRFVLKLWGTWQIKYRTWFRRDKYGQPKRAADTDTIAYPPVSPQPWD